MADTIGYLLNDTARLFRRAFNERAREWGVTALQWRLLVYLTRDPGIRQGPLADLIEVEPITLSRMIDRLETMGMVERRADPTDRRAWQLYLAPKAEPLIKNLRRIAETVVDDSTEGLSEDEQAQLSALVERVRANLSRRETLNETT